MSTDEDSRGYQPARRIAGGSAARQDPFGAMSPPNARRPRGADNVLLFHSVRVLGAGTVTALAFALEMIAAWAAASSRPAGLPLGAHGQEHLDCVNSACVGAELACEEC